MQRTTSLLLFVLFALGSAAVLTTANSAQKKGKSRLLTTSQMMAGVIKPKYVTLKASLAKGPQTEDDWEALAIDAAWMNESGYLMMDDGRCPDAVWKDAANLMKTSAADLLAQIEKRDAAAATKALESVRQSCKDCHRVHKDMQ